jgi:hypothetical protein
MVLGFNSSKRGNKIKIQLINDVNQQRTNLPRKPEKLKHE